MARGKGQQESLKEPESLSASLIDWAIGNPEFDALSQAAGQTDISTVKQERLEKVGYEFLKGSIAESSEETPVLPERLFSPTEAKDLPEMPIEQLQSVIDEPLQEGQTYYDADASPLPD